MTSRRPCWWSRTKAFLSSGNETLFSCKFFEEIFFCFDPQHGRLVTWLQTKNFKCRAGHYTLPIADYVKPKGTRLTRHSSDHDVLIPKCRTKLFQFSYFDRIAKLWNALPVSTRTLSSLNRFNSHVLQRYSAGFRTNYDVTNFNNWKSICCRCSGSRNLLLAGNCCY